jgi:hypothetical protein
MFIDAEAATFVPRAAWHVDLFARFPSLVSETPENRRLAIRTLFALAGLEDENERTFFLNNHNYNNNAAFVQHTRTIATAFTQADLDRKLAELDLEVTKEDVTLLLKSEGMPVMGVLKYLDRVWPADVDEMLGPIWPRFLISPGFAHTLQIFYAQFPALHDQIVESIKSLRIVPSKLRYGQALLSPLCTYTKGVPDGGFDFSGYEGPISRKPLATSSLGDRASDHMLIAGVLVDM